MHSTSVHLPAARPNAASGIVLATRLETGVLAGLSLLLTARYLWVFTHHPLGPANPLPAAAWFGWADQAAYGLAAHAWAAGDLAAAHHLYPSGYALLAAPFVALMPGEPFAVPNLLCWLASLWCFAGLSARLVTGVPGARALGGVVFTLVTVVDAHAFYTWEIPWTSTPAAALTYGALLLGLRYQDIGRERDGLGAAVLAGSIVLFRPTDALVIVPLTACLLLPRLPLGTLSPSARVRALTGYGAAFAIGPALLVATHLATHGWALGPYFAHSRLIGFEFTLLPLRWTTLMLNPRPLYPEGQGLAQVYWFMLPGLAGILAATAADRGRRVRHAVIGGGAVAFLCLYLCYRDLQVLGLFEFRNQHYFKWIIPLFALYALGLLHLLLVRHRWAAVAAACLAVALLSCWRPQLEMVAAGDAGRVLPDGRGVVLPNGLPGVDSAVLLPAREDFLATYFGDHTLVADGLTLEANAAFKAVPVPNGIMVVPLRPLPPVRSVLHFTGPALLDPAAPVLAARQAVVFGLPCAIRTRRAACTFPPLLAPAR